jgi:hypothetical protein
VAEYIATNIETSCMQVTFVHHLSFLELLPRLSCCSVTELDKLALVVIFARDMWANCYPADAAIVWHESQRSASRFG